MEKYVCIHGHFYQPPRENPWLEEIEVQDSAYPYHDWNERISNECYGPNGTARILDGDGKIVKIANNYERISFNFGPTILMWMEKRQPRKYGKILEGDKRSREVFEGHGSAIAQVYNHMIMPLANTRDKKTQIAWGKRDFQHRFGRDPEGMWLAETAVDLETLELLVDYGIKYTILAPRQAHEVRQIGTEDWNDVSGGQIDPTMAYKGVLPSGRDISLFVYDGPISQAIAFEKLLVNGEHLAGRLLGAFSDGRTWPQLVHIATDGESYGHHHRHGEMALAYALDYIAANNLAKVVNYGYFLAKHPPTHELRIFENSSWSCIHGIERWRSDCGCNSGGYGSWNQGWRAPLREALDYLREALAEPFEQEGSKFLKDPWAARDDYIDILLDRSPEAVNRYLENHGKGERSEENETKMLQLMELQRHCMLMYTSCGWFFDELSGIETVQVIEYAGRAIQLAQDLFQKDYRTPFLELLEKATSNIPEHGNGKQIYLKWVEPHMIDLKRVGAHYAISSIFEEYSGTTAIDAYSATQEEFELVQAGRLKLGTGQAHVYSDITHERESFSFGVLHLGDHNVNCGMGPYMDKEKYQEYSQAVIEAFKMADIAETIRRLDDHFDSSAYNLNSLFTDEKRKVLQSVLEPAMDQAEGANAQLYELYAPLILFLRTSNLPIPKPLEHAAEFVLNFRLRNAFQQEYLDPLVIKPLIEETKLAGIQLDETTLEYVIRLNLEQKAELLVEKPQLTWIMEDMNTALQMIEMLPFPVNTWKLQNMAWELLQSVYPEAIRAMSRNNEQAKQWVGLFKSLAEKLWVEIPEEQQ